MKIKKQFSMRIWILLVAGILIVAIGALGILQHESMAMAASKHSLEVDAQGFADAFVAEDAEAVASFMAEDIVAMYPLGDVPDFGREANYQLWVGAFQFFESHPISTDAVSVANSKDVGYSTGRWASRFPDGTTAAGRYVATWVSTDEGWKITNLSAHIHTDIDPLELLSP